MKTLLHSPLIAGASVSAGHLAPSPGLLLSRKHGTEGRARTFAWNGARGFAVCEKLAPPALADRSVLIGVDLFFWDATHADCGLTLRALDRLARDTADLGLPVVLGTVPALLSDWQPSAERINEALERAATRHPHLRLLRLDQLLLSALLQGGVWLEGRHHGLKSLLPDGLHLGLVGSRYVASELERLLSGEARRRATDPAEEAVG